MKITAIETLSQPEGPSPSVTFVLLHTDEGVTGLGETYYTPKTVAAYVHEAIAPVVLGTDPLHDAVWDTLYAQSARRVGGGTDMRAISAIDLALWDLKGKAAGLPVFALLGGADPSRSGVAVYNTCAGIAYAASTHVGRGGQSGPDDLWRAANDPGGLAQELRDEGFVGMKVWPFDAAAQQYGGMRISSAEVSAGRSVVERIRDAVGDDLEIMLEGHAQWDASPALKILEAVAEFDIQWAEDFVLAHDPATLRWLSERSPVPLAASEYLGGRWQYRQLLEQGAIQYLHLDPSWCGGISEAQKILALTSAHGVVASMHDCTGPINLLAGLHLAAANQTVAYQEVLRSYLSDVYPTMVDTEWTRSGGLMAAPDRPGLGAELTEQYLAQPGLVRQVSRRD